MSIRESIQIGHPALKKANAPITDFSNKKLGALIEDLTDTMEAAGLVGMAAPQIAENFQVFVTHPRETPTRPKDQTDILRVFINPKLVFESKEQVLIYEGCGSVLHATLFGPVIRPQVVTIEAFDQWGKKFRFTADGILGRVMQHEYDHMFGIEFLEKISDYKKLMSIEFFVEKIKTSPEQMKASVITKKKFEDLSL